MSKNGGKGGKESRNSKEVSVSRGLDKNLETPLLLRIETEKIFNFADPNFLNGINVCRAIYRKRKVIKKTKAMREEPEVKTREEVVAPEVVVEGTKGTIKRPQHPNLRVQMRCEFWFWHKKAIGRLVNLL